MRSEYIPMVDFLSQYPNSALVSRTPANPSSAVTSPHHEGIKTHKSRFISGALRHDVALLKIIPKGFAPRVGRGPANLLQKHGRQNVPVTQRRRTRRHLKDHNLSFQTRPPSSPESSTTLRYGRLLADHPGRGSDRNRKKKQ